MASIASDVLQFTKAITPSDTHTKRFYSRSLQQRSGSTYVVSGHSSRHQNQDVFPRGPSYDSGVSVLQSSPSVACTANKLHVANDSDDVRFSGAETDQELRVLRVQYQAYSQSFHRDTELAD